MKRDDRCTMSILADIATTIDRHHKSIQALQLGINMEMTNYRFWIKRELKLRGVSVVELAKATGIKKEQLKSFLYSGQNLCGCTLHQLAEAMEKTPNKNCPFQ